MDRAAGAPDRPRRAAGVLECAILDELLVYVPTDDKAVALNVSARAVWELCAGAQSLPEIAETLGRRLGLPGEALLPDVRQAVTKFRTLGLIGPAEG